MLDLKYFFGRVFVFYSSVRLNWYFEHEIGICEKTQELKKNNEKRFKNKTKLKRNCEKSQIKRRKNKKKTQMVHIED